MWLHPLRTWYLPVTRENLLFLMPSQRSNKKQTVVAAFSSVSHLLLFPPVPFLLLLFPLLFLSSLSSPIPSSMRFLCGFQGHQHTIWWWLSAKFFLKNPPNQPPSLQTLFFCCISGKFNITKSWSVNKQQYSLSEAPRGKQTEATTSKCVCCQKLWWDRSCVHFSRPCLKENWKSCGEFLQTQELHSDLY